MDNRSEQNGDGASRPRSSSPAKALLRLLLQPKVSIPVCLVLIFGLLFSAHSILNGSAAVPEKERSPASMRVDAAPPGFVYEEVQAQDLESRVKEADYAIIEAVRDAQLPGGALGLEDVEVLRHDGRDYHHQVLRIALPDPENGFRARLESRLAERVPMATVSETQEQNVLAILIDGVETHLVRLMLPEEVEPEPLPEPAETGPMLAVVIDDMGEDLHFAKGLAALDFPVGFAVWPNSTHAGETAALARRTGHVLLVHLPMQPQGYPEVNPGRGALLVGMTAEQIAKTVDWNLDRVPGAVGVNNHMGSLFTSNTPGMKAALKAIRQRKLFFLDSVTSPRTVAYSVAGKLGMERFRRDVFLDNVKKVEAITHQLRKAERIALKRGWAVAIGHPHKETLAALKSWYASRSKGLRVVPITKLPQDAS